MTLLIELLFCHRCCSSNLYAPVNSPQQQREYDQAGIFMLYCPDCDTFQNHEGKQDSYRALSEMRKANA